MEFRNRKIWRENPTEGFIVAIAAYLVALLVRLQLQYVLDDQLPTFFFTLASICVAARYGLYPALLTIALSLPTGLFFFVKPYDTFEIPTFSDALTIMYFTVITVVVALVLEKSHRSKYNSDLNARVSDSRFRIMTQLDKDLRNKISNSL
jgi:K+-sensing histidine kinase KdpD